MRPKRETALAFAVLTAVLAFLFLSRLGGNYLYLAVVEDPAALYSFFPWDLLSARQIHAGHFPLWNPFSGTGMPHLANLQSSVLFPLKWLYFAWPSPRALDLMVILRLALAGTFTFMLCREMRLSRPAAWMGAFAFALSGYMIKHFNMVNVSSEMWMPLIMWMALRQRAKGPSLGFFLVTAAAIALVMAGGNPEAAFYVIVLGLGFAAVASMGAGRKMRFVAAAYLGPLALGGIIASIQVLPFIEYLGQGFHIHDPNLHTVAAHPARMISSLVAPWLLGPSGSHPAQVTSVPYVGGLVLLLAMIGAGHSRGRTPLALYFTGAAAALLSLAYELPGLGSLAWLPPFNRFGNVKFAMAGFTFFITMLAAIGVDTISRGGLKGRRVAPALAVVSLLLLFGAAYCRQGLGALVPGGVVTPLFFLIAGGGVVLYLLLRPRRESGQQGLQRGVITVAILAAVELGVLFLGYSIRSMAGPELVRYRDPSLPESLVPISEEPGNPRFTGTGGAVHPNLNLIFGVSDLRAFDGIYPKSYVRAMGGIEAFSVGEAVENFFSHGWLFDVRPENLGAGLVDELSVAYVISEDEIEAPGFERVSAGGYHVYRNVESLPRIRMEPAGEGAAGEIEEAVISWDRVEIEATGPGAVVVADTRFPGWRAGVDGREQSMGMARGLFRTLEIGPGPHRIIMIYRPRAFRMGLWSAIIGLLGMAAALVKSAQKE